MEAFLSKKTGRLAVIRKEFIQVLEPEEAEKLIKNENVTVISRCKNDGEALYMAICYALEKET